MLKYIGDMNQQVGKKLVNYETIDKFLILVFDDSYTVVQCNAGDDEELWPTFCDEFDPKAIEDKTLVQLGIMSEEELRLKKDDLQAKLKQYYILKKHLEDADML